MRSAPLVFPDVLFYHAGMNSGHQAKFDGVFGDEEGSHPRSPDGNRGAPPAEPPLAGLFGAKKAPLKASDCKSPAESISRR